jgi:transposase
MSRHHISDALWQRLQPLVCPPRQERRGRPAKDARLMLNGILWVLRTGAPWRDLPEEFGPWETVYKRFNAWAKSSLWKQVLNELSREADSESILMDGSYVRAHQHSAGAKGGATPRRLAAAAEA